MSTLISISSKFDKELKNLKLPKSRNFTKIPKRGTLLKVTPHKVTGKEMNTFVDELQECLVEIDKTFHNVFVLFRPLSDMLKELNREHMAGFFKTREEVTLLAQRTQSLIEASRDTDNLLSETIVKIAELEQRCESKIARHTTILDSLELQTQTLQDVQRQFAERYEELLIREKDIVALIEQLECKVERLEGELISPHIELGSNQHTTENAIRGKEQILGNEISNLLARQEAERKSYKQGLIIAYALSGLAILLTCIFAIYGG